MGKSQGISTVTRTAKAPGFRLSRYQWLALISAYLGWMFDSMDLNLLALVLVPSVGQLRHSTHAAEIGKIIPDKLPTSGTSPGCCSGLRPTASGALG